MATWRSICSDPQDWPITVGEERIARLEDNALKHFPAVLH
jgi:hypothetical protein